MRNSAFKFLSILLIICPVKLFSQGDNISETAKGLSLKLDKSKEKKVEQVSAWMSEAGKLVDESVNLSDEGQIRNNLSNLRDKFENSREQMGRVYEGILEDFYNKANRIFINKFDHARYYDQKVDAYQNAAASSIYSADSVKEAHASAVFFAEAYDNLINAFINQLRAIRVYQDFPIEYPYDWDDFFKQRQIMLARQGALDEAQQEEKEKQASESFRMIYYRVQIAAHSRPIPPNQISAIYKGNMQVQVKFEDGWYKYTIGSFERYDLALALLRACQVKRAFIVAYDENDVKQNMKEIRENP